MSENTTEQVSLKNPKRDAIKVSSTGEEPKEETIIEDTVVEDSSTSTEEQVDATTNTRRNRPSLQREEPVEPTESIEEESLKVESTKADSTDAPQPKKEASSEINGTGGKHSRNRQRLREQETSNASIAKRKNSPE